MGGGILKRSDPAATTGGKTRARSTQPRRDAKGKIVFPLTPATPVAYRKTTKGRGLVAQAGEEEDDEEEEERRRKAAEAWDEAGAAFGAPLPSESELESESE